MDKRLQNMEDKLDDCARSLQSIDVTLAKQEVNIAAHIRRTDTIEKILFTMIAGLVALAFEVLRHSN